jgi:Fe-S cluster assembly protein SufB
LASTAKKTIEELANQAYPYGFITAIDSDSTPPGLSEDIVRIISAKKNEPRFMLDWRLRAYRHWVTMEGSAGERRCANVTYPPIDYQKIVYYSAPKQKVAARLEDLDPELLRTFE